MLRKEALDNGVPRSVVDASDRPTRGVVIPPEAEGPFPERLGPFGWSSEDPGPFRWDIITRLRAHWLLCQDAVACGWVALAMHGLPHWADSEPVDLYSMRTRRNAGSRFGARFRPMPAKLTTVCPDRLFPTLRCVDAATALAQCLSTVARGKKTWWAPAIPGLDDREVRMVQLVDATYQCTYLTADQILAAAYRKVNRRVLEDLLTLCDYGAQSPMESVLRLMVRDTLADIGGEPTWTSQVTVSLTDGQVVKDSHRGKKTTPDLACTSLRVALYYDGRHHDGDDQTDTDFRLFQQLRGVGWEAVRINRALLADPEELMKQVNAAISRAAAAPAAE